MNEVQPEPIFLSTKEVAKRTGLSIQTLSNDRQNRRGFPYVKHGRRVLYFWPEIFALLQANKIDTVNG